MEFHLYMCNHPKDTQYASLMVEKYMYLLFGDFQDLYNLKVHMLVNHVSNTFFGENSCLFKKHHQRKTIIIFKTLYTWFLFIEI